MTLDLRVTARAAAQIERADAWWRENRLAAPGALRDDLRAAFALLMRQPGIGSVTSASRVSGVRRLYLDRVCYFVYYDVEDGELRILALWHAEHGREPRV